MKKECYIVYVELTILHEATYSKIQDDTCKVFFSYEKAINYKEELRKTLPPDSDFKYYYVEMIEKEIEDADDNI